MIWLATPRPMNPAPTSATRIGRPSASRRSSARSTMIMRAPRRLRQLDSSRDPSASNGQLASLALIVDTGSGQSSPRCRVVPAQPALGRRRIGAADLVGHLGPVDQGLVAVRKVRRYVERAPVGGAELDLDVLEPGGRPRAHVDDDVDHRSRGAADQLRLRMRRDLVVHAAHRAGPVVEGEVALRDGGIQAGLGELGHAEGAGEEAAVVGAQVEVDDGHALDGRCGR